MTDNASIAADIAEMNRLMKVYATFDAESLIAKVLDAEIDRLSDVIEAALKVETTDLVTRLIPAGGMALTAEQVEDVRKLSQMDPWWSAEHVEDVQAMLPVAVHSGDDRCPEMNVMNDRCCFLLGHDGLHRACGYKWSTAPAEPAEEETKAEYPRTDGDFTVLGPEIFTDASGEFICWKGVNYVRQPDPASSPVVPAPTETGPWQHRDGRICVYVQHLPLTLRYRIGRFNLHGDFVHDDSKRQLPEGFAPFVAAEEGWT